MKYSHQLFQFLAMAAPACVVGVHDFWCDMRMDRGAELFCVKMNFPRPSLITIYRNVPTTGHCNVYDCSSCEMFQADRFDDIDWNTSKRCNSCTVCSDRLAYDCSNLFPDQQAAMDCAGVNYVPDAGRGPCPPEPSLTNDPTTVSASVNILTDDHPLEVMWFLLDLDNNAECVARASYGDYTEKEYYCSTPLELQKGHNYYFGIEDSGGDGVCCEVSSSDRS